MTMYYGETVLNSIGEDAFWREADSGDTLYIAYIIGYPKQRCRSIPMIGRLPTAATDIFTICTACIRTPTVPHPPC